MSPTSKRTGTSEVPTPQAMRSIIDALPAVVSVDLGGGVELINASAQELLQCSEHAVVGRPLSEIGEPGVILAGLAERVSAEGRALHGQEVLRPAPLDPMVVWAMPRFSREGFPAGVVLLMRVAVRSSRFLPSGGGAERTELYQTLVAGLSHEVRNPLGGIRGATQLMEADLPPRSPLREHTAVVIREVDRLAALVDRLLALGRPAALDRQPTNLHRVLDDVIDICIRDPGAGSLQIRREYDPSLPDFLADADALAGLFLNLLRNAAEATAGKGTVTVSTRIETGVRMRPTGSGGDAEAGVLRVTVADDGAGVPEELQARLFMPFATGKRKGTGLGLALARKTALDHGGWIVCSSAPGEGAAFTVYLPAEIT